MVGVSRFMHTAGLVAELPAGSESDVVFVLGSPPAVLLPVTRAAPPARFHAGVPGSNDPPGARKYWFGSPEAAKAWVVAGQQVVVAAAVTAPAGEAAMASATRAAEAEQSERAIRRTGDTSGA
jgi:hypothetical protein